jgi:PPOX class probable F420-dependent enzyme
VTTVVPVTIIPDDEFGTRVRGRLEQDTLIWLTTTSADGTPQPNPVWFLWEEAADSVLTYTANNAVRLTHIALRPRVALNFDTADGGDDVVVLTGVAEQALDAPAADQHAEYLDKYRDGIARLGSDPARFAADYGVPVRIVLARVRGF